jgi:hypothetical protein
MSHTPRAVSPAAAADYRASGAAFIAGQLHTTASAPETDIAAMAPTRRSSVELQAKAHELRGMATTATTADVKQALLVLADRYEGLAAKRKAAAAA